MLRLHLLFVAACCAVPAQTNPFATDAAAIDAGRNVFRIHCAGCHGRYAQGGRAPDLTRTSFVTGNQDSGIFRTISNGVAGTEMTGYQSRVGTDDIWRIIAFLRSLTGSGGESIDGDSKAGESLFWGEGGCGNCHAVGVRGNRVGPDLSRIGPVRSIRYLRESLVSPSADIIGGYIGVTVVTKDGKTVRGIEKALDDYSVMLIEFSGKVHSFDRASLKSVERDTKSLMPEYGAVFTATELNNVLAYLLNLKGPEVRR